MRTLSAVVMIAGALLAVFTGNPWWLLAYIPAGIYAARDIMLTLKLFRKM